MYSLDDIDKHPLLVGALHLANNSVKESSQKSYQSAWNKWEKFVQKYFTNSINSQNSNKIQKLMISQKSQNDSSLQNSTNAKYTPNYKKWIIVAVPGYYNEFLF